jgi:hypothetical protein
MQERRSQLEKTLKEEYSVLQSDLSEKGRRKWAGFPAQLDERHYQTGIKVSEAEMKHIDLHQDSFHGEWNYFLNPN